MTKYNELNIAANKDKKRVGRGISAGGGKTAGRGTKGQKSRTVRSLTRCSRVVVVRSHSARQKPRFQKFQSTCAGCIP